MQTCICTFEDTEEVSHKIDLKNSTGTVYQDSLDQTSNHSEGKVGMLENVLHHSRY